MTPTNDKPLIHEAIILPRVRAGEVEDDPDDDFAGQDADPVFTYIVSLNDDIVRLLAGPFRAYVDVDNALDSIIVREAAMAPETDAKLSRYFYLDYFPSGEFEIMEADSDYIAEVRERVWMKES